MTFIDTMRKAHGRRNHRQRRGVGCTLASPATAFHQWFRQRLDAKINREDPTPMAAGFRPTIRHP